MERLLDRGDRVRMVTLSKIERAWNKSTYELSIFDSVTIRAEAADL